MGSRDAEQHLNSYNQSSSSYPGSSNSSRHPDSSSTPSRKRASDGSAIASKRRRTAPESSSRSVEVIDLTGNSPVRRQKPSTPRKAKKVSEAREASSPVQVVEERRLKRFRPAPPQTFIEKFERATTQRMFVIGRKRTGTDEHPEETVDLVGSTGNIYTVKIQRLPSCNCPDAMKGNQCKHIIYVVVNVLKAEGHLQYQLAYLGSELREMFEKSPVERSEQSKKQKNAGEPSDKRRPIEGDCPICFMEFEPEKEETVWCETCGNNVHKTCFNQWAATQQSQGVRCVYCRATWPIAKPKNGDIKSIVEKGYVNEEGYVNVASSFGLSGERDWSTYHTPYGRRSRWSRYDGYYDSDDY